MPLPLIDLAAGTRALHAAAIDHALRGPGFFAIRGHGVDIGAREAALRAAHRFPRTPDFAGSDAVRFREVSADP